MKRTLDDLCELITDGTHQTPEYCGEDGVIFLSSKDVVNRKINWEQVKYIPQSLHDVLSSRLKPQRNDILLAKNGTTGVAALVDCEKVFDIYVSLALLRPKKSINPKFLLHAINSPATKRQFDAGLKGIGVPNLHLKEIKNTTIDVPNENMQSHIVNCLETLDGLHENWIKQLAKLDTLVKSRFIEMFGDPVTNPMGWEVVQLSDVAKKKLEYGSGASARAYDGKTRYIRITDITEDGQLNNDIVSPCDVNEKYVLHEGDILFARSGATVGKAYLHRESAGHCLYAGYLIRLIPDEKKVVPDYVFAFTKTQYYRNFVALSQKVVAQPNINAQQYGALKICLPPIALQNQFADFVQQVDKSKSVLQKLLEKQELLRAALMQEYFG